MPEAEETTPGIFGVFSHGFPFLHALVCAGFLVTCIHAYADDSQIHIHGQDFAPEQQTHRNNLQLNKTHTDVP